MTQRAILIVEDDANWKSIFKEIVTDCGFKPVVVATYQGTLSALAHRTFALAIVDISLFEADYADRSGMKVLKAIAETPTRLPAIVVTGYATVDLAIEALVDLNAVHFFRKDKFDRREFGRIIKREARVEGSSKFDATVLKLLSEREQEVLALLAAGQTNKQIGDTLTISVNTVKKHVQSIFTKLNVESRAAAVGKALNVKR